MEAEPTVSEEAERPRRRRREQQQQPPASQGSPIKGAILVAVAVVIGLVLLRDDGASTAQIAVGADDNPAESSDDTTSSTSSTTAPARPTSEVKVLVANGSGVNGAAGAKTTELEALGYVTANPTDAERVTSTVVYFTDGYQAEAEALAASIGAAGGAAQALPTPAPVGDMQLSNLLIVLGPDLATAG